VNLEQGAMSAVNPLTATAFLEIARQGGHNSIVLTAAASALGQMVNRLGRKQGVRVINVVRREAQVDLLKQQGAGIVLNSSEAGFDGQLREVCHQQGTRLAFDAVAGPMTGRLLAALPQGSRVTIFGGLSMAAAKADPDQIIFEKKSIDGFWLGPWIAEKNLVQILLMWRRAQQLMATDLKSEVRARYPFREAKKAVQDYLNEMTGGKMLLVAGQ
jgi:NADPH:quinone reductase-like Zn-dependent oxidoreductase